MHRAFDLGITLFDAADTYGNGLSEELIAKAFPHPPRRDRHRHQDRLRRGQRTATTNAVASAPFPTIFRPQALTLATENALRRLKTDRIDLLQLHNIGMEQADDDSVWETLDTPHRLRQGALHGGFALGPAIGWMYEGIRAIEKRPCDQRAAHLQPAGTPPRPRPSRRRRKGRVGRDTMFLIRVTHSSGMLEGRYTEDTTVFPPTDHRVHRPRSWLLNGIKKVDNSCVSSKARTARWARRRCSGCWRTPGWPRRCPTSTTRRNSPSSPAPPTRPR